MGGVAKLVLVAVAIAAVVVCGSGMLLAYSVVHGGMAYVKLHQHSSHGSADLDLPVPVGLLATTFHLAALAGPSRLRCHLAALRAWRPAARAACRALAATPDGTVVDVASGPETVRVKKRGDAFEIDVHGLGGRVRVIAPAGLVWRFLDDAS